MIELEIFGTGKRAFLPESLSECDPDQYINMCRYIYLYQGGKIEFGQFLRLSLYSLMRIQPCKQTKADDPALLDNLALLSDYVMNFFEKDEETEAMKIKLGFIHNPMPSFRHRGLTWKGPADNFEDVTFGQYVEGLGYLLDYEKFKEQPTLWDLLRVFYKPKYKFAPKWMKDISELDIGVISGFYHYFASFHKHISTGVIWYSGEELDLSLIFSDDGEHFRSTIPGLGIKSVVFDLAESGVFGPKTEVENTRLWEILLRLYDLMKKGKDEKAKLESEKRKK